jgi:hypothetical protein
MAWHDQDGPAVALVEHFVATLAAAGLLQPSRPASAMDELAARAAANARRTPPPPRVEMRGGSGTSPRSPRPRHRRRLARAWSRLPKSAVTAASAEVVFAERCSHRRLVELTGRGKKLRDGGEQQLDLQQLRRWRAGPAAATARASRRCSAVTVWRHGERESGTRMACAADSSRPGW